MNILFILKKEADLAIRTIMAENGKNHKISMITLSEDQDYDALVEQIEQCDKVITW